MNATDPGAGCAGGVITLTCNSVTQLSNKRAIFGLTIATVRHQSYIHTYIHTYSTIQYNTYASSVLYAFTFALHSEKMTARLGENSFVLMLTLVLGVLDSLQT